MNKHLYLLIHYFCLKLDIADLNKNRVGRQGLFPHLSSHTTVRAVPYTVVPLAHPHLMVVLLHCFRLSKQKSVLQHILGAPHLLFVGGPRRSSGFSAFFLLFSNIIPPNMPDEVRVSRGRSLPPVSFIFHLAVDTLSASW